MSVFYSKTLYNTWRTVRPWGAIIALFLLLRYSGALSGISYLTSSALMKSGIMDIQPEPPLIAKKFDYNFSIRDLNGNIVDVKPVQRRNDYTIHNEKRCATPSEFSTSPKRDRGCGTRLAGTLLNP